MTHRHIFSVPNSINEIFLRHSVSRIVYKCVWFRHYSSSSFQKLKTQRWPVSAGVSHSTILLWNGQCLWGAAVYALRLQWILGAILASIFRCFWGSILHRFLLTFYTFSVSLNLAKSGFYVGRVANFMVLQASFFIRF